MLTATIVGSLSGGLQFDETGQRYCTIYSDQANRAVRALIRNDKQAALISRLPKHSRLTASGLLRSKGAIGNGGKALAFLTIIVQQIQIHEISQ